MLPGQAPGAERVPRAGASRSRTEFAALRKRNTISEVDIGSAYLIGEYTNARMDSGIYYPTGISPTSVGSRGTEPKPSSGRRFNKNVRVVK
jgi:hypothetical protein